MKKLFLNLNILCSFTVTSVGVVACDKTPARNNNNNNNSYNMGETKDFDLKSLITTDFQLLANDKKSEEKTNGDVSNLEKQISNKIFDTIFEQITGNKTITSDELKALKEINFQIIDVKFELINKNQQLKTIIEVNKWEDIERIFKCTSFPTAGNRLIKGLAELGLNNVKKYYDHIKNNKAEFIIEYGDRTFYSSIESAKKILEEDNKNNINDYQFYMELNPLHLKSSVKKQLEYHLEQLLINQPTAKISVVDYKDHDTSKLNLTNNLVDKAIDVNRIKLEFNQPYQTVIKITDKNDFSEYIPINFQLKILVL